MEVFSQCVVKIDLIRRYTFVIFIIVLNGTICSTQGQEVRADILSIVDDIANANSLEAEQIGIDGRISKQWLNYKLLADKAATNELITLTDHENGVVRCYSFMALAAHRDVDLVSILLKHMHDTLLVERVEGCVGLGSTVGDYFIDVVTTNSDVEDAYRLNDSEQAMIDSILYFDTSIKLYARGSLLKKHEKKVEYWNRLKELYDLDSTKNTLIETAKMQRDQDVPLVLAYLKAHSRDSLNIGLRAVRYFPHPVFFPYLEEELAKELKYKNEFVYAPSPNLFQAIVQYQNKPSLDLLELAVTKDTNREYQFLNGFIWVTLEMFPHPIYSDIKNRLTVLASDKAELKYWMNNTK
jgi:hypothetical protein